MSPLMRHFKRVLADPVAHNKALEEYMTMTPAQPNDPTNSAKPPTHSPQPEDRLHDECNAVQAALDWQSGGCRDSVLKQVEWRKKYERLLTANDSNGLVDDWVQDVLAAHCRRLEQRVAELEEHHNMQLAGISMACVQNTETSKRERITQDNPYWTVAYGDVCVTVDREIRERTRAEAAEAALAAAQAENTQAAKRYGKLAEKLSSMSTLYQLASRNQEALSDQLADARRKLEAQSKQTARFLYAYAQLTGRTFKDAAENAPEVSEWNVSAILRALAPVDPAAQTKEICSKCDGSGYLYTLLGTMPCPECNPSKPAQPEQKEAT